MYCSNQGAKSIDFLKQNCTPRSARLDHTRYHLCHRCHETQLDSNQRARAEGRFLCSLPHNPRVISALQRKKLDGGPLDNSQLPITSPEWHGCTKSKGFPLPQRGRDSLALFHANAGVEQARISGAPRGKCSKPLLKCFLHRHHNLKMREGKSLNAEREGSFGCDIRHRFLP